MKKTIGVRFLAQGAVIAALYTIFTYVSAMMNLAYGPVQFRFSEALTILPVFTGAAVPGLAVGCLLSNLGSPLGPIDWVFGTLATLLAAVFARMLRKIEWKGIPILSFLMPVLFNAAVVGFELACLSDAGSFAFTNISAIGFAAGALSVGIGELVICLGLGIPLFIAIRKSHAVNLLL